MGAQLKNHPVSKACLGYIFVIDSRPVATMGAQRPSLAIVRQLDVQSRDPGISQSDIGVDRAANPETALILEMPSLNGVSLSGIK
jgi:hypothetical protein